MITPCSGRRRSAAGGVLAWTAAALFLAAAAALAEDEDRQFQAGAATSNITPPLGATLIGGWGSPEAEHIHDELWARCLVLDNGSARLVFVIIDNLGASREVFGDARERLAEKTGIPAEHMLMASTHTHSAPSARPSNVLDPPPTLTEYQQFIADRIVDGVRRAINNLEPARIGWGAGDAPGQVFNRRWFMADGFDLTNPFGETDQVRMNPPRNHEALADPAGPTDPEIAFLAVESTDGRPMALLANYSLHYVGGVPGNHVSADYFGVFAREIGRLLAADGANPDFVGIMSNGTSGDVNNINFRAPAPQREPYEQINRVASIAAAEVYKAYQTVEFHDWVALDARMTELTLEVRKPSEAILERARRILEDPDNAPGLHAREEVYARRAVQMHESPGEVDIPVQALRVGGVGVAAIPFEVFAETGLEIKEKSPFEMAFAISFGNGGYGYLPTPQQHELGGYETWLGTSRVEIEAAPKITASILEKFDAMAGDAE